MWTKHVVMGIIVLAAGVGVRTAMVVAADPELSGADLIKFENTYGLDLPDWYDRLPFFLLWTRGDGQAFVVLASDLDADGPAQELAVPVYRYSRAGYAWLGRLAALGRNDWVPIGLMAVNSAALVAIGSMASALAHPRGPAALLLTANPAIYVGFASDTAEPLGVALLMAVLTASDGRGAGVWAGLLAAVRPSLATAVPARGRNLPAVLIPLALVGVGLHLLGSLLFTGNASIPPDTLVLPMTGYVETWRNLPVAASIVVGIPLFASIATIYWGLTRRSGWARLSWIVTGFLVLTFGSLVLQSPNNWTRAAAGLPVLWGAQPPGNGRIERHRASDIA